MANPTNPRHPLLQMAGCCFALALAFLFAQPASAATIHSGSYSEDGPPDQNGDTFTITNDASSTEDILTVVLDLTMSPNVVYDIAGPQSAPFSSTDPYDMATVDGALKVLTITFLSGELSPGTIFTFTIDVDTTGQQVTGSDIAGSEIRATFDTSGDVVATMVVGVPDASWASPVPEPGTLTLLGLGLTGLAWGGRRRR